MSYRQTTSGGCGCGGGGTPAALMRSGSRQGRIDANGACVCDQCEECDGLQCLCRPRFFDGQLITAADFRRLDHYMVGKSRLHNRYLHGVGVVCGLEVVCNPCEDTMTVRAGYALGPCGEDIVVCGDARVDVAALIKEQRASVARVECSPYDQPVSDAEAARQKWVLGICYDERPARPVTGLKRATGCGCGGSCSGSSGGSSGGGCNGGCGGSCGGACSSGATSPASCEPTQICEGFRFTLTKLPRTVPGAVAGDRLGALSSGTATAAAQGELPRLVMACLERLRSGITQLPNDPSSDQVVDYARELKADLRDLVDSGNVHDCTLGQRLNDIVIPDPADQEANPKARAAVAGMLQIAVDLFRDCVCSALLPPCGTGCADDCVPLAVLTVRSSDLRVLDICNWSARKFAITMPALTYWLGWIPIFSALRDGIARLCCEQTRAPGFRLNDNLRFQAEGVKAKGAAAGAEPAAEAATAQGEAAAGSASFAALAAQYAETWSSLSGVEATVLGALGAQTTRGQALASDLELANPLAALTIGRLGVGAGATLLPPELARRFVTDVAVVPETAHEDRIAVLEESLTKLKKTVDTQARTIRTLKAKGPGQ